jgi:hypothetical protein
MATKTVSPGQRLLSAATNAHDLLVNMCEFLDNGTPIHGGCDLHDEATEFRKQLSQAIDDYEDQAEVVTDLLAACDLALDDVRSDCPLTQSGKMDRIRVLKDAIDKAKGGAS